MPEFDLTWGAALLALAGGYLLGSVPFGMVLARLMGLGDLRRIGSGNIGATNVLRTGNKRAAALTLLLDAGKGLVAVLAARALAGEAAAQLAGLGAFLGHLYPVWLRFAGGKGVATFLGVLWGLAPWLGLAACATWLVVAAVGRISSAAALVTAATAPAWALLIGQPQAAGLTLLLGVLIWWRHRANIARLLRGEEPRIGARG